MKPQPSSITFTSATRSSATLISATLIATLSLAAGCKQTTDKAEPTTTVTTNTTPATTPKQTTSKTSDPQETPTPTQATPTQTTGRLSDPAQTITTPATKTSTITAKPGPKPGPRKTTPTQQPNSPTPQQPKGKKYKVCDLNTLPPETARIAALIRAGGPFKHPRKDGSTFGNREGRLPKERRGYYREYTVLTPGVKHRGARRIVTGGNPATNPPFWYYTKDHYGSFCLIGGA